MKAMNLQVVGSPVKSASVIMVSPIWPPRLTDLVVGLLQEFVEQAQLAHQLEGGRVDRVAAEIAQEIAVLLQHDDIDAGARQQEAEHHPGRPAAGDAALGGDRLRGHVGHTPAAPPSARGSWAPSSMPSGCRITAPAWPIVSE